ncbi:MAG: rhamnulokinase family protein [Planctomycetota bacterium]
MNPPCHIAIDLGGESGRAIVGWLDDGRLRMHEVYRFGHTPLPTPARLVWDFTALWSHVLEGLKQARLWAEEHGKTPATVGVDTWGVDWTLLSRCGEVLGLPACYRDPSHPEAFDKLLRRTTRQDIYHATGVQLMPINTLYQLAQRYESTPGPFFNGGRLLFIPDLLHWLLTGVVSVERTIASTSQLLDARTGDWNTEYLRSLGMPTGVLGEITAPGAALGPLTPEVAKHTGLGGSLRVVAVASHDTASAVVATPAQDDRPWAFLSSGTWSLLGAELDAPVINDATYQANFTNELGYDGTVRFLKNIGGLWLIQQIRSDLESAGQTFTYAELTEQARGSEPLRTLIDPDHPPFLLPGEMRGKIERFAKDTGQPTPETPGQFARACLESLALAYARTLETLDRLLDRRTEVLHIIGGGGKNELLNEMTAQATGVEVRVGPYEATAAGNLLVQTLSHAHSAAEPALSEPAVSPIAQAHAAAARSFEVQTIRAAPSADWADAADRFAALCRPPAASPT